VGDTDALQTTHNCTVYHRHFFEILCRVEPFRVSQDPEKVRQEDYFIVYGDIQSDCSWLHDRYDKITDNDLKDRYMHETVEVAYPFVQETKSRLNDMIAQLVGHYATCVTQGDVPQAQKQLRLYQREQVRPSFLCPEFVPTNHLLVSVDCVGTRHSLETDDWQGTTRRGRWPGQESCSCKRSRR
jgi:hypothetical protein